MRVTTDFWVSALVRRAFSLGGFAAVSRRGAAEAGAVLIVLRGRAGDMRLYAPAPQASYDEGAAGERLFAQVLHTESEEALNQRIERELRFDSDVWTVELELGEQDFLTLVPVTTP